MTTKVFHFGADDDLTVIGEAGSAEGKACAGRAQKNVTFGPTGRMPIARGSCPVEGAHDRRLRLTM